LVAGYYTATLPGGSSFGSGYLALTLDAKGNVKTVGKMADGTAVSLSSTLLVEGPETNLLAVIYSAPPLYKGGCLFGLASFGSNKILQGKGG